MQPDQAKFLLDFLLPRLKSEQATTKKILSAVPPDKGDYKPHPKSMSSLKLSWHLAATEMWFLDAVIDHVFKEDDSPMPSELKPGAQIARWYDENFAHRLPRLEALSGEHLAAPVDYIGLLNDPAVAYIEFCDPPFRPPSRPAFRISPTHGRKGSRHLRRKRRRTLPVRRPIRQLLASARTRREARANTKKRLSRPVFGL